MAQAITIKLIPVLPPVQKSPWGGNGKALLVTSGDPVHEALRCSTGKGLTCNSDALLRKAKVTGRLGS